jgi:hypothetical protein
MTAMPYVPTPLLAASDAATDGARKYEVHFEPPQTPELSRCQAQQDNVLGRAVESRATRVDSSGFVHAVIPRRRGNENKLVLTRELLESHYHEPLDTVAERLGLSKTTIKASCRRLGLEKWPYTHKGARLPRQHSMKQEQDAANEHGRTLKATFHELMGNTGTPPYAENLCPPYAAYVCPPYAENVCLKRKRVEEEQPAPTVTLGVPVPLASPPPAATLTQLQSILALSAMVSALGESSKQRALNPVAQAQPFTGQAPATWMPVNLKPYSGTSIIRNNPPPLGHCRALGTVLL